MPPNLRLGQHMKLVAGRETVIAVRRLRLNGFSHSRVARALGISVRHAEKVWSAIVREARAGVTDDERAVVRRYLRDQWLDLIERSMASLDSAPAYGAVAAKGLEALGAHFGIEPGSVGAPAGESSLLHQIAENARRAVGILALPQSATSPEVALARNGGA